MEEAAQIPPGLPRGGPQNTCNSPQGPTVSYWQDPPSNIADHRSTQDLPSTVDYIIIGSGISGACIAYNLFTAQPSAKVLLLEARQACSGATGRNGGHTKAASYRLFLDHEREFETEEAVKIARLEYENMRATHAFARAHGIECASTECETIDVCYSQLQWDIGIKAVERMREVMGEDDPVAEYRTYSAEETERRFLCPGSVGSFGYAAGSLSAYDFTIGVLNLCIEKGLNLQTNTPVHSISCDPTSSTSGGNVTYTAQTSRGAITAANIVLATNGYTPHLLPQLQGLIVLLHGQIIAQRPGQQMPQTGLPATYSFVQESGYEYLITRPPGSAGEGDIIIGGGIWQLGDGGASRYGNTDDTVIDPTIRNWLRRSCVQYFGKRNWGEDHKMGRVKREWSGIMGASADGLPYVGKVPGEEGVWISASFNGHGMVWCLKSAEALVGMMTGSVREVEKWFPKCAWMSEERMRVKFEGRRDLRKPEEGRGGTGLDGEGSKL